MAMHDPQTLARWKTLFATWRSSGLTVTAFCRSRDLNTSSFYRWRTILDGLDRPPRSPTEPSPPISFVPVRVIAEAIVEVILPSGLQLRVPLGADARQVARLVLALGAEPC